MPIVRNRAELDALLKHARDEGWLEGSRHMQTAMNNSKEAANVRLQALAASTEFLKQAGQLLEAHTRAMCSERGKL